MVAVRYNQNELIASSDIQLTKRAARQRWVKKTEMDGCTSTVSFAKEDWRDWVKDMPNTEKIGRAIAANRPVRFRGNGKTITLTPPIDKF